MYFLRNQRVGKVLAKTGVDKVPRRAFFERFWVLRGRVEGSFGARFSGFLGANSPQVVMGLLGFS